MVQNYRVSTELSEEAKVLAAAAKAASREAVGREDERDHDLQAVAPLVAAVAVAHASIDRLRRLGFASGDTEDAATDAHVLHHAPVVVDLAVLETFCSP